jgi:hypothetical protein
MAVLLNVQRKSGHRRRRLSKKTETAAFYNRKRRRSTPGYKSPIRFLDDRFIAKQDGKLVA